jgi:hypothetical protein
VDTTGVLAATAAGTAVAGIAVAIGAALSVFVVLFFVDGMVEKLHAESSMTAITKILVMVPALLYIHTPYPESANIDSKLQFYYLQV